MKKNYTLTGLVLAATIAAQAQVVTTVPEVVQTDSHNIVITFHADQGNRGLAGVGKTDKVYAHTGVITNTSKSDSDWQYAPSWGDNSAKYELTWVADNTWTLDIPDIDSYYGITSPDVVVKKLAFVFRNANSTKEGKTADGGDIFVDVHPAGFALTLTCDPDDGGIITGDGRVAFAVSASQPSDLSLTVNGEVVESATNATTLNAAYTFVETGSYEVEAKAVNGGETYTKSMSLVRLASSPEAAYPGEKIKMGAVDEGDGSVTFCVAAPGKENAVIVGSWDDYSMASGLMNYEDRDGVRYFWLTVPGIADGKDYIYYYMFDGSKKVGDPYARLILDPYNDQWIPADVFPDLPAYPTDKVKNVPLAIYNSERDAYNWQVKDFKGVPQSQLVIYELLIRDFSGSEGQAKGEGTIKGVLEHLDHIQQMGVNAVELLPIMEFNGNNSWGYNTNFYFAPDKAYGTPDDYRYLIDECHKRGMAVILDIVFNQSDGLHPWYQMYPIASNPFYNGSAPHAYSVLNDWNQDNPLVQQQWHDALAYWMEAYKVDGFRFDLVKGLGNNDSYGNTYYPSTNTWGNPSDANTNRYNATRVARMKELHDAMRQVNPDAYFINENLAGAQEENEMAADGEINWANINYNATQFANGQQNGSGLNRFYAPLDSRTWGSTVSYAESHDEERMAYSQTRNGVSGVKNNTEVSMRRLGSVAAQMLMTPGAHMIWQFQEFGADQTTKNSGGNDTSPKKVVWSYMDNEYRAGLYQSYVELCNLRRANPTMFTEETGTTVSLDGWNEGRYVQLVNGTKEIWLVVNPTTSTRRVNVGAPDLGDATKYQLLSHSYNTTPQATGMGVTLDGGAYALYGTLDITDVADVAADVANVKVFVQDGSIVISGSYNNAAAYTADGRACGMDNLRPGLYIVKVDNAAYKVAVR